MAYSVDGYDDFRADNDGLSTRKVTPQKFLGGMALAGIVVACGWILFTNLAGDRADAVLAGPTVTVVTARPAAPAVTTVVKQPAPAQRSLLTAPVLDVTLMHATYSLGGPSVTFSQSTPMTSALRAAPPATRRTVASIPMPAPRPAGLEGPQERKPSLRAMAQRGTFALASTESTPFDKIFGRSERAGPALAFAAADGGVANDGQSITPGRNTPNDGLTAVYDISARTVYMPDGTKLEAHSGLRNKLDDPRYVHVRMWGATPPHTYDLVPREQLFHGVQALRLIPHGGEGAIFGRTGLLAHTYMLGPNGDSNGCVSFKDYNAFLHAYQNGKVKRLVVVASGGRAVLAANN